jgi:hypothetical protein
MRRFGGDISRSDAAHESESGNALPARRFSVGTWCLAAAVIGCAVLIYLTLADIENEKKLATIRTAVEDYAASVKSLAGRYEVTWQSLRPSPTSVHEMALSHTTTDFLVDLERSRMASEEFAVEHRGGPTAMPIRERRFTSDTVEVTWFADASTEGTDDWGDPHTLDIAGRRFPDVPLLTVAGLRSHDSRGGLASQIRLATPERGEKLKYEGTELVQNALCDRVSIESNTLRVTLWLDPALGYLPRRQQLADRAPGSSERARVFEILDFQQYRDEHSGTMRWFPSRGRFEWPGFYATEFKIEELTINPAVEEKRFHVDIAALPDGVKITDRMAGPQSKISFTGDREDLWEDRERLREQRWLEIAQKTELPTLPHVPLTAPANDTFAIYRDAVSRMPWWGFALVATGIGLLIARAVTRVRRRLARGAGF